MKYQLLGIGLLFAGISFAQSKVLLKIPKSGTGISAFIPEGYDTIMTAKGDMNKDAVADLVLVVKHRDEDKGDVTDGGEDIPERLLLVLFRKADSFQMKAASSTAILCKQCGGIFGDPFEEVAVEKGVLIIRHYGGSAWRWGYTHKFRYQNNGFYLIGQTTSSYWNVEMCEKLGEFAATKYEDINFVTGNYVKKEVSQEGCKLLVNKKGKRTVKPLLKMDKFSVEN